MPGEAAGTVSFTTLLACADDEPQPPTGPHSLAWVGARRARNGPALQLSHGQVLVQIVARELELQLSGRDVTLSLQPMGQASGFVQGALAPLAQGAAVVTLPRFDAAEVAQARQQMQALLGPAAWEAAWEAGLALPAAAAVALALEVEAEGVTAAAPAAGA